MMNHIRMRSRSRSRTKVKRSPKTKQKSPRTKLRSSVKRKSPGMKLRSIKRSIKRKLSPKIMTTNKDSGKKKIKSRRKKEVHYQRPLVPNYKIIRNKNTSYYEKREEQDEQFYPSFSSYPMNSYNNISVTQKSSSLSNDNIKNAPLSSFVALDDDKVINKNAKINEHNGMIQKRRNTRSRKSFKKDRNLKPMKLILSKEDFKIIQRKILKDYTKGNFDTYDELPENLKLMLTEDKYHKMIKKFERKHSVPQIEPYETVEQDETKNDYEVDDENNNIVNEQPKIDVVETNMSNEQRYEQVVNEMITTPSSTSDSVII